MEIKNTPTLNDEVTTTLRGLCAKRATTIAYMIDEAKNAGVPSDEFAWKAVYQYGVDIGEKMKAGMKDPTDMIEFASVFGVGLDKDIYEMETIASDNDKLYIDFHFCPYVERWMEMGRDIEELPNLCKIAMEGDRAIGDSFEAFDFTLGKTIAEGNPVCEIRFDRVKK